MCDRFISCFREGRYQDENRGFEENHFCDFEWREDAIFAYDNHPICNASSGPHIEENAPDFLGNCSKIHTGWENAPRDDSCM